MPHDWAADAQLIGDLAVGRLPAGVGSDTAEGKKYLAMIAAVETLIANGPPLSDAQLSKIIPLLRGAA